MIIQTKTKTINDITGVSTFVNGNKIEGNLTEVDRVIRYNEGQAAVMNAELRTFSKLDKGSCIEYDSRLFEIMDRELHSEMVNLYFLKEIAYEL